MPPRRSSPAQQMKQVSSQILYAATGKKEQYEETIDAVVSAVELFVSHVAVAASFHAKGPHDGKKGKIKPEDILLSLKNDSDLQAIVGEYYKNVKETAKELNQTKKDMKSMGS